MLSDALPFCLLTLNPDLMIEDANMFAESVFGVGPEDIENTPLTRLIAKDDMLFDLLRDTLSHGIVMKAYDHEVRLADGRNLRAHLYVSPMWDNTLKGTSLPQPVGAYLAIDSLLGADRIGKQITQREISKRAGLMAAMLAHEVKNPLSGIRGAAQLLQEEMEGKDEEVTRLTKLMMREVDRISATLGKVEFLTNSAQAPREPVNIHEVLHYVLTVLDPSASKKITFREVYDPSIPEVQGNRDLLIQLFLNLAKNAAEAVRETPHPVIAFSTFFRHDFRLRMKGRTPLPIIVSVMDNGPGIPLEMHETIFDPYVTTKKGGNGLGLSICAKIVAEHGGIIELTESQPGHTVFSVMLPAARR